MINLSVGSWRTKYLSETMYSRCVFIPDRVQTRTVQTHVLRLARATAQKCDNTFVLLMGISANDTSFVYSFWFLDMTMHILFLQKYGLGIRFV